MMFLWQHLVFDLPRGGGGDGGTGGNGSDSGAAQIGGGENATPGYGAGANEAAAGNIAGTSGGPENAAANAIGTGNADVIGAFADMGGFSGVGAGAGPSGVSGVSAADMPSANATPVSGALSGLGISDPFSGSSLAAVAAGVNEALGPTGAGAFGLSGAVGVDANTSQAAMASQGISPTTDASTGLSSMGLGDVAMGGFGPGGITGTGETEGVSGLGMGAGNISGGLGSLGEALGNVGPAGFSTSEVGYSTTDASSTPFGGAAMSSSPQGYASPSIGMGFGVGPSGISMGAPYSGADVDTGMIGATGVPGSRANAMAEQQAHFAAQEAAVMAQRSVGSPFVGTPGVSPTVSTAAVTPTTAAPAATPAATTSPTTATTPSTQTSSIAAAAAGAPSVSAASMPGRAASSMSVESFTDPLTGAPVSVTNVNGEESISLGQTAPSQSGIASIAGHPVTSALVNAALTGLVPGYGPANAVSLIGTGTSLYGQAHSLATGQGFQTGGGLMGLAGSGALGVGSGQAPATTGTSSAGGGTGVEPTVLAQAQYVPETQAAPAVAQEFSQPASAPAATPMYDLSNFLSRGSQPVTIAQTQSPAGSVANLPGFYSDYLAGRYYRA